MTQKPAPCVYQVAYPEPVEEALSLLTTVLQKKTHHKLDNRWLALRLLDADASLLQEIKSLLGETF